MAEKANIMGLSVDVTDEKRLYEQWKQDFQKESLSVIFLVTIPMIEKSTVDAEYKCILEQADYLLPADETVLSVCPPEIWKQSGIFKNFQCLFKMCEYLEQEREDVPKTVYYVGKTREETQRFVDYASEAYGWLKAQGMFCEGMEEKDDLLVNEINSVSPDILLVALDSPLQEQWISKNSTKLNVKICLGIGRLFEESLEKNDQKKKGFGMLEAWKRMYRSIHRNIFQKKAGNYLKKKEKEQ